MSVNDSTATLLIVEDEAIVAMDLREQLLGLGYQVCGIASNADKAIAQSACATVCTLRGNGGNVVGARLADLCRIHFGPRRPGNC